jgi:hypothetical protein
VKLLLALMLLGMIANGVATTPSDPPLLIDGTPAPTTASN